MKLNMLGLSFFAALSMMLFGCNNPASSVTQNISSPAIVKSPTNPHVYFSDKVAVLMYHSVSDKPSSLSMSPQLFQQHMNALKENGFNVISMNQYVNFLEKRDKIPDNAVLLTFDDGYEDFYTNAYPILKRMGYPATNFIIVKYVDSPYKYDRYQRLNWTQIREMYQNGMTFYSHSFDSHHKENTTAMGNPIPALSSPIFLKTQNRVETQQEYGTRIKKDLAKANELIQKNIGEKPEVMAYPYGAYNNTVLKVEDELGIKTSFTIKEGLNDQSSLNSVSKRLNVTSQNTTVEKLLWKLERHYK